MARRTAEEILAQREAWLARKAGREAGQDIPIQSPLKQDEVTETPTEPVDTGVATKTKPARPEAPESQRSPEEIRAQREAFLAARAAKAAGRAPTSHRKPIEKTEPAAATPTSAPKATTPAPKEQESAPAIDPNITRRELLNYAWLASIGLFAVETVGLSLWFAFPNFRAGEFGSQFDIGPAPDVLPETNAPPIPYTDGKYWLANVDTEAANGEPRKGVLALYNVCTHLGCLYAWVDVTYRFECPCHGSKFELTGDYIEGPARRSLDRFVIRAISSDGTVKETDAEGNPLLINGDETLVIDTGQRILGKPNA